MSIGLNLVLLLIEGYIHGRRSDRQQHMTVYQEKESFFKEEMNISYQLGNLTRNEYLLS